MAQRSVREPEPPSTRERILSEASDLFARQGYHGTSTREIAAAVGVRQPSLFYHFPSKAAIVQALLASDLDDALPYVLALARDRGPAATRLYRYLRHDVTHLAGSPYNLSGVYTEEVMGDPEFTSWTRKRERLHGAVERIVQDGIDAGEFVRVPSPLIREAIAGILVRTLMLYSGRRRAPEALADEIAGFVLRGLLTDPDRADEVRRAAGGEPGGEG